MTAIIGTVAEFHCAGKGIIIFWLIDGLPLHHPNISGRGIVSNTDLDSKSGFVLSKLTIPATLENNNTSVQCALGSEPVFSYPATLRVLPSMCKLLLSQLIIII